MLGALIASAIPFLKSYGVPHGWSPDPATLWRMARRNMPVAAADAVEWGSRRIDIAVLGLFVSPAVVGIYYVAQNVASLPSKLKTSFDPILGPVIARNIAAGDKPAVAKQVRQVGFWVIAAQSAVALALASPAKAVMGLVGPAFVAGTAALAFLLAAEVVAATAAVSEAALIYIARNRNMVISLAMIVVQAAAVGRADPDRQAARLVGDVAGDRAGDRPAAGAGLRRGRQVAAAVAGCSARRCRAGAGRWSGRRPRRWSPGSSPILLPEWAELSVGIPAILLAFGAVLWRRGFTAEDRELFRMRKSDIEELSLPDPGSSGGASR